PQMSPSSGQSSSTSQSGRNVGNSGSGSGSGSSPVSSAVSSDGVSPALVAADGSREVFGRPVVRPAEVPTWGSVSPPGSVLSVVPLLAASVSVPAPPVPVPASVAAEVAPVPVPGDDVLPALTGV